jgi:hypothetical protein
VKGELMTNEKSEGKLDLSNLFKELEACRNLKKQLIEEAKRGSPFSEECPSREKLDKYVKHLQYLQGLYEIEKGLLKKIPIPPSTETT